MTLSRTWRRLIGQIGQISRIGLIGLIGLALAATASLAQAAAPDAQRAEPAPLPDLAAQFKVTLTAPGQPARQQTWQLTRSGALITWLKGPHTEELWRQDRSGIRLERVLRSDRHVIDYSAGELRALGVAVDWSDLATLFPIAQLDALVRLKPGPAARTTAPAQHWAGRIGAEQVDLLWDPVARLPLRLARSSRQGRVLFERLALHPAAPPSWPLAGADSGDFQRIDAADFGDMDYNPVVRRAEAADQRAGWRKAHSH